MKSAEPVSDAPRAGTPASSSGPATLRQYIAIARPDHWTKNLFMLPGVFIAVIFSHGVTGDLNTKVATDWSSFLKIWPLVLIGLAATCLISSANYTINEWLDRHFDRFHPIKRSRPSVAGNIQSTGVIIQYILLCMGGLALAAWLNQRVFESCLFLLVMGVLYNVQPFRTKDRLYLDVVSESINNPIRLCIGWFIVISTVFPPSSLLLGYWFGGAFLMAVKRFAEFRAISDQAVAGQYRRSFKFYTEESLLGSAVFHAMAASLFIGVFLVKHRIEFIVSFPFIALLFAWYVRMGYDPDSAAQRPEKLLGQKKFMVFVALLTALIAILFLVDIPALHKLLQNTFNEL